jgi:hypothetical protein
MPGQEKSYADNSEHPAVDPLQHGGLRLWGHPGTGVRQRHGRRRVVARLSTLEEASGRAYANQCCAGPEAHADQSERRPPVRRRPSG